MKQFVAPVAVSVLLGGCATTGKPVPGGHTRNVVVMEVGKVHDPVAFSGQLVDVAKRCWIGKNEAFSGLDVQGVGPWSEIPDTPSSTTRVISFRNTGASGKRHLAIYVGQTKGATAWNTVFRVMVEQTDAEAAKSIITSAANSLEHGTAVSCSQ